MSRAGLLLCLVSAVAFGAMAIFGKLAFADGTTVGTLLTSRFGIAAVVLWAWVLVARVPLRIGWRAVCAGLLMGAVGYAVQSGAYFAALTRLDASVVALLLYTYPALVAVASSALGRDRLDRRGVLAVGCAAAGLLLVLADPSGASLDGLGVLLGLTAAGAYTGYILAGESVAARVEPRLLSAIVCTGAALSVGAVSAARGDLQPAAVTGAGWVWIAGVALICTVVAVACFLAGVARVGAARAALLSTAEPLTTVALAAVAFGDRLGPLQALGGAFVVAALVVTSTRGGGPATTGVVAAERPLSAA